MLCRTIRKRVGTVSGGVLWFCMCLPVNSFQQLSRIVLSSSTVACWACPGPDTPATCARRMIITTESRMIAIRHIRSEVLRLASKMSRKSTPNPDGERRDQWWKSMSICKYVEGCVEVVSFAAHPTNQKKSDRKLILMCPGCCRIETRLDFPRHLGC
jgi:hypothetical protein